MFIFKNEYYLFIENTSQFNPSKIKIRNKFNIIYRNNSNIENISKLKRFSKICRKLGIKLFIANKTDRMIKVNADGLYISAHNRDLSLNKFKNSKYQLIGAAHNLKEVNLKIIQGCNKLIFSRLFKTNYKNKKTFLGIIKFNSFCNIVKLNLIPLGGINLERLNSLNSLKSSSLAVLSVIKKKPAKFINRLF
tara:strand:+ start:71 stop:646 length:576 start_codon:yes stop_codon:yes gene_type:complete